MTHCTRTTTVLDLLTLTAATATYGYDDGPDTTPYPTLTLPADRYTDLGSPDEVTVTIEPGDHLNDDDGDLVVDTITITRVITPDGDDVIGVEVDGDSGLTMHLGMLALTHDTLTRHTPDSADDDA